MSWINVSYHRGIDLIIAALNAELNSFDEGERDASAFVKLHSHHPLMFFQDELKRQIYDQEDNKRDRKDICNIQIDSHSCAILHEQEGTPYSVERSTR